jgi:mRNA interferase MazF
MTLSKGDVVTVVVPGDNGKPRPAVVVQANPFAEVHPSLTVCPLTTHLTGLRLFRVAIAPEVKNGLRQASEVMVDKVSSVSRNRIGSQVGKLSAGDRAAVDEALRRWFGLD